MSPSKKKMALERRVFFQHLGDALVDAANEQYRKAGGLFCASTMLGDVEEERRDFYKDKYQLESDGKVYPYEDKLRLLDKMIEEAYALIEEMRQAWRDDLKLSQEEE